MKKLQAEDESENEFDITKRSRDFGVNPHRTTSPGVKSLVSNLRISSEKANILEQLYDELNESVLQEMNLDFDEHVKELEHQDISPKLAKK